ncbi:MAG: GGDEF domain-containing protein [bacterium]
MDIILQQRELFIIMSVLFSFFFFFFLKYFNKKLRRLESEKENLGNELHKIIRSEEELKRDFSQLNLEYNDLSTIFVVLPDLARELSSSLNVEQIGPVIIRIVKRLIPVEEVCFFLFDKSRKKLILKELYGLPKELINNVEVDVVETNMLGLAVKKQTMLNREELQALDAKLVKPYKINGELDFLPLYISPLIHRDEVLGLLTLNRITTNNKHIKKYLSIISNLGAVALKNALLMKDIQDVADKDGVTGLYNHRYFQDKMFEEKMRADREQMPLSLFMIDIDKFKIYNDKHGHQAGDTILNMLAKLLKEKVRAIDTVARYGGEEFAVILSATEKKEAFELAKRLREIILQHDFPYGESQPFGRLTISGGVASYPKDANSIKELIKLADKALYQAKEAGRNQIIMYELFDFSKQS